MSELTEKAAAKINLTLRVLGRRDDGYHELESLVAFAALADKLDLEPGRDTTLQIIGPFTEASGPVADNLVLKAAAALRARVDGLEHAPALVVEADAALGLGVGRDSDVAVGLHRSTASPRRPQPAHRGLCPRQSVPHRTHSHQVMRTPRKRSAE